MNKTTVNKLGQLSRLAVIMVYEHYEVDPIPAICSECIDADATHRELRGTSIASMTFVLTCHTTGTLN